MSDKQQNLPLLERVQLAAAHIRQQLAGTSCESARVGLVLGSGLGGVTQNIETVVDIPYREIPYFPSTEVEGHRGRLLAGLLGGAPLLVLEGRVHGYEGHAPEDTTFAVRVMAALGIKSLVVTNASGGIRQDMQPGCLVAISDHINLTGVNPAAGLHDERLGPRFFDMSDAYSARLRARAIQEALRQGWRMVEGCYVGVEGPSFETPAEIRAFRTLGADMVGMSTVHEVIIARQCGMEVLGISCVTNLAAGVLDQPLAHDEVMEIATRASGRLGGLLAALVPQLLL